MKKIYVEDERTTTQIFVACRENGEIFEECKSIAEAVEVIARYEEEDKRDGTFTEDYYDIVDEERCTIFYREINKEVK